MKTAPKDKALLCTQLSYVPLELKCRGIVPCRREARAVLKDLGGVVLRGCVGRRIDSYVGEWRFPRCAAPAVRSDRRFLNTVKRKFPVKQTSEDGIHAVRRSEDKHERTKVQHSGRICLYRW